MKYSGKKNIHDNELGDQIIKSEIGVALKGLKSNKLPRVNGILADTLVCRRRSDNVDCLNT